MKKHGKTFSSYNPEIMLAKGYAAQKMSANLYVTKSAVSGEFDHIYYRNSQLKTLFLSSVIQEIRISGHSPTWTTAPKTIAPYATPSRNINPQNFAPGQLNNPPWTTALGQLPYEILAGTVAPWTFDPQTMTSK